MVGIPKLSLDALLTLLEHGFLWLLSEIFCVLIFILVLLIHTEAVVIGVHLRILITDI